MDTLIRKPSSRSRYAWRISGALSRAKAGSVSDAGKGFVLSRFKNATSNTMV